MIFEAGTRLGPYEIVARVGAGGMGEVWKAIDTRLDRSVAIKVLPAELAENPQFRSRFEREAKTISQLNHPNICTLYDVGDNYLVMELIEGESLADRIARGPLPISDVLRYGGEIADALDRAHRAGVIHRDVKPANVMLTRTGAKLLDFGLSKGASTGLVVDGPTMQKPLTQEGTILGTFQYMAPEQLEGEEAGARTDIFALGALLYEMLTGKRAFEGKTRTSLIAAIVTGTPRAPVELQPLTPPSLEHLIERCLEKDPEDRWQSAHDIAQELRWIATAGSQAGLAAPLARQRHRRNRALSVSLAATALAAVVLGTLYAREILAPGQRFVLAIPAPAGVYFNAAGDFGGPMVISPDGTNVVFSAGENQLNSRLFVRDLQTGDTRELPGTEGGMFPFWSPDGKHVAFFSFSKLKRISLNGGTPSDICPVGLARGGSWGPDDTILFTPGTANGIRRVSASGGEPVSVTRTGGMRPSNKEGGNTTHRWPEFLPDGKHFIYLGANHFAPDESAVYLASIDGKENRRLFNSVSNAIYASGHLLYGRDGTLYAQKLSRKMELQGDPVRVADDCFYDPGIWRIAASTSRNGILVFQSTRGRLGSQLSWFDRAGQKIGDVGERDLYFDLRLSPDGSALAVTAGDPRRDLWIMDLERGVRTRVTGPADFASTAIWSRDGKELWFARSSEDGWGVASQRVSEGRAPDLRAQLGREAITLDDFSPDGKFVVLNDGTNLLLMDNETGETTPLPGAIRDVTFSPDGRWIAYEEELNDRTDVFVSSFPARDRKWQVTPDGGSSPRWRGSEIFFSRDLTIHAARVSESDGELRFALPEKLFALPLKVGGFAGPYDVTADGQRILANLTTIEDSFTATVVSDWEAALE